MTKFTAIDPSGGLHKRTSVDRTYTHTVVSKRAVEWDLSFVRAPDRVRVQRSNFRHHLAWLDSTSEWLVRSPWESEERHKVEVEQALAKAREVIGDNWIEDDWIEAQAQDQIARIEKAKAAGYYDQWVNDGWCGRLDLAQKLASKMAGQGRVEITILEAKAEG